MSAAPLIRRAVQAWIRKHPKAPAIVYDSHGAVFARSERLALADVPAPALADDQPPSSESLWLPGIGHVRRMTASLASGGQSHTVVLFRDLEHIDEEMGEVVTALMITAPVALALAAALAYGVSRRSLAPVEQLRQRTDEITADRLDRRLPIANPTDELGLLAQTVNSMIERLERSFAEIRRFTADASHELRTPLAVIRSESELGLDPAATLEDARARFGSILEECARLTRMTDQLLTLSREDAGIAAPKRDRVPLLSLVRETAETMTPLAAEKRQTLTVNDGEEVVVSADAERLRQVLYNLLANAIKYTPEEGKIEASLERRGAEARAFGARQRHRHFGRASAARLRPLLPRRQIAFAARRRRRSRAEHRQEHHLRPRRPGRSRKLARRRFDLSRLLAAGECCGSRLGRAVGGRWRMVGRREEGGGGAAVVAFVLRSVISVIIWHAVASAAPIADVWCNELYAFLALQEETRADWLVRGSVSDGGPDRRLLDEPHME